MLAAAESRHIVAVCKRLAEADKVSLDSVVMVGAGDVETEACAYVVEDKNYAVIVAPLADALPVFLVGGNVVVEVAVVIGLSDKTCDVAVVVVVKLLKCGDVKPRSYEVVANVLGKNTGIVDLLRLLEVAVIIALKEDYLSLVSMCSGGHNCKRRGVRTVLAEECPVSRCNSVDKILCTVNHYR